MSPKHLVAAILMLAMAGPISAQSVKAGIDAWQRADYGSAVAIWRPLAEAGDADAQFNLGQAYRLGRGVPINLAAAKAWFERAAVKGHLDALTTLGLLLFQNGNQAEALKWLKQAAEQGEPRALLVYGTALFNGDGVTQDQVLGYAYVSRAAAQGLAPARETLAQLDKLMPVADRKKGVAIARAKAKVTPPPTSKPVKAARASSIPAQAGIQSQPRIGAEAPPGPRPSPGNSRVAAAASVPATGGWRIQLGAFSQRGAAEALYQKLSGKSALSGRRAFYIPVGAVTRLQVGPFETKAVAAAACSAVGVPCFPVAAK